MVIITSIIVVLTLGMVQFAPLASAPQAEVIPPIAVQGIMEQGEKAATTSAPAIPKPVNEAAYAWLLPRAADRSLGPVRKEDSSEPPTITATAAAVFDVESKKVLYEKNPETMVPLASITKLMTALVVMDESPDFNEEYVMQPNDRREGGRIYFYNGDRITKGDLFNAMLVGSANTATIALVHSLGFTEEQFVYKMNEKAYALGLRKTSFADPVGLNPDNRSTAFEVLELTRVALAQPVIQEAVMQDSYTVTTKQGSRRTIASTDQLLSDPADFSIAGGKTGYLREAGYCFTGGFSDANGNRPLITVVLGSETIDTRFSETTQLVDWVYTNHQWP